MALIADRLSRIKPSATMAVTQKALKGATASLGASNKHVKRLTNRV